MDSNAAQDLMARMSTSIRGTAESLARRCPGLDADDLAQDGMLAAFQAIDAYAPAQGAIEALLWTAAKNAMLTSIEASQGPIRSRKRNDASRGLRPISSGSAISWANAPDPDELPTQAISADDLAEGIDDLARMVRVDAALSSLPRRKEVAVRVAMRVLPRAGTRITFGATGHAVHDARLVQLEARALLDAALVGGWTSAPASPPPPVRGHFSNRSADGCIGRRILSQNDFLAETSNDSAQLAG
jgi:RNA polymerase sigma factor (sigma-70 family)